MATALEKRVAALEAARHGVRGARPPDIHIRNEGGYAVLVGVRYPVGRTGWRDATPDELEQVREIFDRLEDTY